MHIIGGAARCALLVLMWRLSELRCACEGAGAPSAADVATTADLRDVFVSLLEATLRSTEEVDPPPPCRSGSVPPFRHEKLADK